MASVPLPHPGSVQQPPSHPTFPPTACRGPRKSQYLRNRCTNTNSHWFTLQTIPQWQQSSLQNEQNGASEYFCRSCLSRIDVCN
ncbi:uncharacterized protein B0H18DRAFT_597204 [Fomitopsis serialis]|uniref:uncharacterized protein n=1 Tax=Fomitopsis serialis TaxID=139415 RepID=UPI0020075CF9|nr:uncharacterized protein B0H18DRAFT_597204 [Neoantrodia serialis]KAH9920368.1 hypothetical protein B0H18DRAFT_597204 [Neoantrodia serialis]